MSILIKLLEFLLFTCISFNYFMFVILYYIIFMLYYLMHITFKIYAPSIQILGSFLTDGISSHKVLKVLLL